MTREQNQLIKKLKTLSADEIARVQQFLQQLRSPELRAVPSELKAVANGTGQAEPAQCDAPQATVQGDGMTAGAAAATDTTAATTAAAGLPQETVRRDPVREMSSPEAEIAHAACAQWRRRPFQAIDADDLQPIAALFREAVDSRAASRFRYGSR
jgi:hypothetical protein